ncbi:MAG: IS630 family transposase [Paracoccus sp. (in: a-proteobacteria)]
MPTRLCHPKADEALRQAFRTRIAEHEAAGRPIIYLDESGFAADMPRTHGYALRGRRCFGKRDWHAKGRVNVLGALLAGGLLTVGLTVCNVDAELFNLWLGHDLIPKLPPGAVLVMDNATFHKRGDTREMIENAGHSLEYLPPYSPDLNPIEPKWAQAKAIRRRTGQSPEEIFSETF